jgi:prolipoprotein diacylglyceryltransferase
MKGKELNPDASIEEFSRLNIPGQAQHSGLRQKKLVPASAGTFIPTSKRFLKSSSSPRFFLPLPGMPRLLYQSSWPTHCFHIIYFLGQKKLKTYFQAGPRKSSFY